jgi:hypothetical protein
MENVFTAGGNDNLSAALVGVAVALVAVGVLAAFALFLQDKARAAGAVLVAAFGAAVVSFVCSTDAVLVDADERVENFVTVVQETYGLPLTKDDGKAAYDAYRHGDGTFAVNIEGKLHRLSITDKGKDLALLYLGGEPGN